MISKVKKRKIRDYGFINENVFTNVPSCLSQDEILRLVMDHKKDVDNLSNVKQRIMKGNHADFKIPNIQKLQTVCAKHYEDREN
jgi:hypothetical protein